MSQLAKNRHAFKMKRHPELDSGSTSLLNHWLII